MNDRDYALLTAAIDRTLGIDLGNYKPQQMRRRLDAYISGLGLRATAFAAKLRSDDELAAKLHTFLTINVTEFFRDGEYFEALRTSILPSLVKRSARINIWSAGTSNGAEAYTMALLMEEHFPDHDYRVLGTDIDEDSLKKARHGGPYGPQDVKGVDGRLLGRAFHQADGRFNVDPNLRRNVRFQRHDLLKDQFPFGFDLIACRNVVIYFSDEAKSKLNRRFRDSLRPGGVLFIGGAEALLGSREIGFERIEGPFYRNVNVPSAKLDTGVGNGLTAA